MGPGEVNELVPAYFQGTAVWGVWEGAPGLHPLRVDSADSRVGQDIGPTDTHMGIGEGHSAWALGSTSLRGRQTYGITHQWPRPAPTGLWSSLGDPVLSSRSLLSINIRADARQVGAPSPQDGPGGAAPFPSATANGLFVLEAPEISAAPSPGGGRGPCSAPWLFLS